MSKKLPSSMIITSWEEVMVLMRFSAIELTLMASSFFWVPDESGWVQMAYSEYLLSMACLNIATFLPARR